MPSPAPEIAAEIARRVGADALCWFPGLAETLVETFWENESGFEPADYSTAAWLDEAAAPDMRSVPGRPSMAVEPLPAGLASRFGAPPFADIADVAPGAIADALRRLDSGGAADTTAGLVRSVHCINARGPGYDCSHSEPAIPFSVLVSVPIGERHAELRLAESLLHEAMHLQLTLIERHVPIVGADAGSGYSPWQQGQRPVQGLFHGLYVFTAIHQWLEFLAAEPMLSAEDGVYVAQRLRQIEDEAAAVATLETAQGLTRFGLTLARFLLRSFQPAHSVPSLAS